MKRFFVSLISIFSLFVLPTAVFAATTSGPVGSNGLRAYPGPGVGQVTLEWSRVSLTGENYSIKYGTKSASYPYLAPLVGYIATYTVGSLQPRQRYFFCLSRIWVGNSDQGCEPGVEVSAIAPSTPITVLGTAGPVGRNLLWAKAGPLSGQITLNWTRYFPDTEKYHIVYGLRPGKYIYGVLNAKDTTPQDNNYTFTIGSLSPGARYYFALVPQRSGTGIYVTSEVSAVSR